MGRQRPVVTKPFMIIGGHAENSRDGEVIYQNCYGDLAPAERSVFLPDPNDNFVGKVMDLGYLSRYGTPEFKPREEVLYEYVADCVTKYGPAGQGVVRYWFYRLADDLLFKERYTVDHVWQRLHDFYKNN
jgi:hypothetical protein